MTQKLVSIVTFFHPTKQVSEVGKALEKETRRQILAVSHLNTGEEQGRAWVHTKALIPSPGHSLEQADGAALKVQQDLGWSPGTKLTDYDFG